MAKKNVFVTIEESDLEAVKRLTGQDKNATALLTAILKYLDISGADAATIIKGAGGYREESKSYWRGYNWGKKAFEEQWDIDMWRDGAAADSMPDFEDYASEEELANYHSSFEAWNKGTVDGWITAGGKIPS